jgi:hypothetical protein
LGKTGAGVGKGRDDLCVAGDKGAPPVGAECSSIGRTGRPSW